MDHSAAAARLFLAGYNCAQAVLAAFSDVTGLSPDLSRRIASSFGGGIGRMREVCGAVSGMMMAAGLIYGYTENGVNDQYKKEHYARVQLLASRFREKAGSIVCREILKNPPSDPIPSPRTQDYYASRPCVRMVMLAAVILEEYMEEFPPEVYGWKS